MLMLNLKILHEGLSDKAGSTFFLGLMPKQISILHI